MSIGTDRVARGDLAWVVLSGKMASGKDYIGSRLNLPGTTVCLGFGDVLRESLSSVLTVDNTVDTRAAQELGYSAEHAELMAKQWADVVAELPEATPWSRSNKIRSLLQDMGSDWLPFEEWLSQRAAAVATEKLDKGQSVVSIGGRFPSDIELPMSQGAISIRLDVTPETQLRRLLSRDGLSPSPELITAMSHPGETVLDDWEGFTARIDANDDGPGAAVIIDDEILNILRQRQLSTTVDSQRLVHP